LLETLAFFELWRVGRTVDELAALLGRRGLAAAIDRLVAQGRAVRSGAVVGLSSASVRRRRERDPIIRAKRGSAARLIARLGQTPFVRFIGLGNSVAFGSATELSDLDCFVVTAPNRLWTARFLLLLRAKWLGLTKRLGASADRLDFGWWVDETALDLSSGAISDDVHLRYWLACLVPLVDRGGTYHRLLFENRPVLRPVSRRQSRSFAVSKMGCERGLVTPLERLLGAWLGDRLEGLLSHFQRWKILAEPLARRAGADVVITRHECKLHHLDERALIRDRWQALVQKNERW
jgi:hypothetical protein